MYYLNSILFFCLPFLACTHESSDMDVAIQDDMNIHRSHNANVLQQIQNDIIIGSQANKKTSAAPSIYHLDGMLMSQSEFQQLEFDTFFYIEKKMSYIPAQDQMSPLLQVQYEGYTADYYSRYRFTPEHFELAFDENDLLFLSLSHPVEGELFAFGFDKNTGKQAVMPFQQMNYKGNFALGNAMLNRQIDELRLIISLKDSLYIHDFNVEDFYTHDH